ncbi:MAG TPA: luciferase family protein [Rubrobacter sp.]|nr:luciferase family protein [Rubrobacter sp.]
MASVKEVVEREVSGWPGVEARPHRFGGVEFRVRGHEIGHLHGDRMADLPFPVRMRKELVAGGKAEPHHVLPRTGWVSYYPRGPEDASAVVELFRLNYEHLVERGRKKAEKAAAIGTPGEGAN